MRRSGALPALALACCTALLPVFGASASATEPSNDRLSGATPVTVGFSQELDTTLATTDDEDALVGQTCSGPAGPAGRTDASVWYSYEATNDGDVMVDVSGSNYSAGVYVATGVPGTLAAEACGPQSVAFSASAGTTYYVVAFDDQSDGTGNGGVLRISFSEAPAAPTVVVSIDGTGTFDAATGAVTVSGTLACTGAEFVQVLGTVKELGGPSPATGFFRRGSEGSCDGTPRLWTAVVRGDGARFDGRRSTVVASSIACNRQQCSQGYSDEAVHVTGGPR